MHEKMLVFGKFRILYVLSRLSHFLAKNNSGGDIYGGKKHGEINNNNDGEEARNLLLGVIWSVTNSAVESGSFHVTEEARIFTFYLFRPLRVFSPPCAQNLFFFFFCPRI